ncbi:hypothetical protein RJ53_11065 [Methanocalculus chunghsingensis]|uniref:DOMON domain-containing protein n=1 Tax=Methanocalculus chunghsingensis TaxID=156457 RepID=A0A8J8B7S6_9EURY|nr:DOMON domain-containing protein [Methanocalculus chunghsingensis]MBR1369987.1 hypothetical protein [Methanocalculus chunghsingensis]
MIGIVLAFLVFAAGCASDPVTPPAPVDDAPITEEWVPDGIIEPGEYQYSQRLSDSMEIHWSTTDETIQMAISGQATGWVGIGLGTPRMMAGVDYIAGYVDSETVVVHDLYSQSPRCPIQMDTEIGGSNDILRSGGSLVDGVTTIEFERLFVTGDEFDYLIRQGEEIAIIWAVSDSNSMTVPHRESSTATIILWR